MNKRKILERNMPPSHPGVLLEEILLDHLRLSVTRAAALLQVSRQHLHRILKSDAPITAEMALKIGKLAGNGPVLWMNMQLAYDLWHAQKQMGPVLKNIPNSDEILEIV